MADLGVNIVNMMKCRRGEHCLFRSFGLGSEVDSVTGWGFGKVNVELAKWYPGCKIKSFNTRKAQSDGAFEYQIEVVEG